MASRQHEIAVRRALGADSRRLARQMLTEGLLLSAIGGFVGLFVAYWILPVFVRFAPESLPRLNEIALDWRVTVFVAAIIVLIPLIFSFGPLIETIRSNVAADLRAQGRSATQNNRQRLIMSVAIIVQFGLACVLLTAAGLLLRSFLRASELNPGFESAGLLTMRIDLPENENNGPSRIASLFENLIGRVGTLPSVRRAGALSELPSGATDNVVLSIEGGGPRSARADTLFCLGDVLNTLGVRLLKGRLLRPDDYLGRPHTVVVSQSLASRAWRNADDAIGQRIRFGVDDPMNDQPWLTVVGVSRTSKPS